MAQPMQPEDPWRDGEPAYLHAYRSAMAPFGASWAWGDGKPWDDILEQREALVRKYGYAIPTMESLHEIAAITPLFEVGAGCGYWARLLQDLGCEVTPVDRTPPGASRGGEFAKSLAWTTVYGPDQWDALVAAAGKATSLFIAWPYRGARNEWVEMEHWKRLALITDGPAGGHREMDPLYQALDSMWLLDREVAIPTWPYRWDKLMLWSRP